MEDGLSEIGTVVRRFTRKHCVAIELVPGAKLVRGKTYCFCDPSQEIHRQKIDSIEIFHMSKEVVTSADSTPAVKLDLPESEIPGNGVKVFLVL